MGHQKVSKAAFKAKALEYLRQVETTGQILVITDRGKPSVELRPYRGEDRKPLDLLRHSVLRYEQPTEPVDADDWAAAS